MAADVVILKADLDRVDDNCLDAIRRVVDACLLVNPEDNLADQGVTQVLVEYLNKKDVFVRMRISSRTGNVITTLVETSNIAAPGFVRAILWLFIYANKRK